MSQIKAERIFTLSFLSGFLLLRLTRSILFLFLFRIKPVVIGSGKDRYVTYRIKRQFPGSIIELKLTYQQSHGKSLQLLFTVEFLTEQNRLIRKQQDPLQKLPNDQAAGRTNSHAITRMIASVTVRETHDDGKKVDKHLKVRQKVEPVFKIPVLLISLIPDPQKSHDLRDHQKFCCIMKY